MNSQAPLQPSRPLNFPIALGLPLALMLALLLVEPNGLDFAVERLFYSPGLGFVGRHSFWLEDVLHDRAKQAVYLIWAAAVWALAGSFFSARWYPWRRNLVYLLLALAASTAIVAPLKAATGMHCPWSLTQFGGQETFKALLAHNPPGHKAGRCWPGGHASAGFSLLALFFALRDQHFRAARWALWAALGLGSLFSLGRMAQGAHFLSHNLWTLLIDWTICLLLYRLLLYRKPGQPACQAPLPSQITTHRR